MPVNWFVDDPIETKTPKEVKEEIIANEAVKKALYGAGSNGWTKDWFEKILTSYRENNLTITGEIPEVNMLLSRENLKEEDLTDNERLTLMLYAHPIRKIKIKTHQRNSIDYWQDNSLSLEEKEAICNRIREMRYISPPQATSLSIEWHKLNNFKCIDEVYVNYPNTYKKWVKEGNIPFEVQDRVENNEVQKYLRDKGVIDPKIKTMEEANELLDFIRHYCK